MIAYVIGYLMGVAVGIVAAKITDWLLPEEAEDEHDKNTQSTGRDVQR